MYIQKHIELFSNLKGQMPQADEIINDICNAISSEKKVLIFGNGGSAAQAQHFAAEFIVRFKRERKYWDRHGLPVIALSTDTSILTAASNDYSFDNIFAIQVSSLAKRGDILLGLSTSGNSDNVLKAFQEGSEVGTKNIGLLGKDGGFLGKNEFVDRKIIIPSNHTDLIQVGHLFFIHYICDRVEACFDGRM